MSEIDPSRIIRVPIKEIAKPRDGLCEVKTEYWWIVDPVADAVIFYRRFSGRHSSPLCNKDEAIVRRVLLPIWEKFGCEVQLVPVAFTPIWVTGDVDFGYQLVQLLQKGSGGTT